MAAHSTESIAEAIREKVGELNALIKQAEDNHAITSQVLSDSQGIEVKMWLKRQL